MKRYQVRRHAIVESIDAALKASGCRIIEGASPTLAPFLYKVLTPQGEILKLVCYAFTANKYRQKGRPKDEHRFQIKYGSEFDRYHKLYFDPQGDAVTLLFGVHLELGIFVAVDPRMHNPTWFSSSVEMKEKNLNQSKRKGWHGWERERAEGRRKQIRPLANLQTEVVVGFKPKYFLRYVRFEQLTSGQDAGERLLMADRIGDGLKPRRGAPVPEHPLEAQLGLSAHQILDVLGGHFRLLAAVRGGVAEHHLGNHLREVSGISRVRHLDADGQPDFEVRYRRKDIRIECKNVLRRRPKRGPKVDFQKTRHSKNDPCSRYYAPSQFEVLAACLHPVSEKWEFTFSATSALEPHAKCEGRLSQHVYIAGEHWSPSVTDILDEATE